MRARRRPRWAVAAVAVVGLVLVGAGAGVVLSRARPRLAPIAVTSRTPTDTGAPVSGAWPAPSPAQTGQAGPPTPVTSAAVSFAPAISYQRALRIVTDLGLQTAAPCAPAWAPEGGDHPWFGNLLVLATPLAPLGWLAPLAGTPGVTRVVGNPVYHCPLLRAGPWPFLPSAQAGRDVRVTFAAGTGYDAALAAVEDLGFRLANPCAGVPWQPAGQEAPFAARHALLVATTTRNATAWQRQLQEIPQVARIEVGPAVRCASA